MPSLHIDDSFTRTLLGDHSGSKSPRPTPGVAYSDASPTPVSAPKLLAWSPEVASLLDISKEQMQSPDMLALLSGNRVEPGMHPYAARYGGHQFGSWAGQLGDGRAITLTEILNTQNQRWELQLKGAGPTPYSRRADGRAVLRSSIREFLCSEAMHHLGVPTTRALSLVSTGDAVMRDMFYDGHPRNEPGAIVARVAPSFVRFGNFQIHASLGERDQMRALADYVITHHFPELGAPSEKVYGEWLDEIARRTALMVAHWMRVGFVHGVMNTDNMSVLGLTIDYGPYGWMDAYEPDWTPNTTDANGRRYRYENQPGIALWNLAQLAGALTPLLGSSERAEGAFEMYRNTFEKAHHEMVAAKLGLRALENEEDFALAAEMFELLGAVETDMTIFHRKLADVDVFANQVDDAALRSLLEPALYSSSDLTNELRAKWHAWTTRYAKRARRDHASNAERRALMNATNPKYVLRNYIAQQAIDAAEQGDASQITTLLDVMRRPYDEQPEHSALFAKRPEWARHKPGCSALSCSS